MIIESLLVISLIVSVWLILTVTTEFEYPLLTTLIVIVTLSGYFWFSPISFVELVKSNYVEIIVGTLIYFVIGIIWSILKWYGLVSKVSSLYESFRADYIEMASKYSNQNYVDITTIGTDNVKLTTQGKNNLIHSFYAKHGHKLPFEISLYKGKIYNWLMFWPFSMSWFLVNKPIEFAWNTCYRLTINTYNRITNYYFNKFDSDFN